MKTRNYVFHNYYNVLNINNFMFLNDDAPGVGEGVLKPFRILKELGVNQNFKIGSRDSFLPNESIDGYVFIDLPKSSDSVYQEALKSGKNLYLILLESPIIRPGNYNKNNHEPFKKVFTWSPELLVSDKYVKIQIPQNPSPPVGKYNKKKFCNIIVSKKFSNEIGELYSKRLEVINFFNEKHPSDFDLYGNGWDTDVYCGYLKFLNLINRTSLRGKLKLQKRYDFYRGKVKSKNETYSEYKFSIAFENFCNSKGYITEKIFDCFYGRCVPVYWGAPDIANYIPDNCFVDIRNFSSLDELYNYLKNMSDADYLTFQNNIESFLISEKYKIFLPEHFANTVLNNLI